MERQPWEQSSKEFGVEFGVRGRVRGQSNNEFGVRVRGQSNNCLIVTLTPNSELRPRTLDMADLEHMIDRYLYKAEGSL